MCSADQLTTEAPLSALPFLRRDRSTDPAISRACSARSLAPVQTLFLAPVLTSPTCLRDARRPSPDGYEEPMVCTTHRWREPDSNHRYREGGRRRLGSLICCIHEFSRCVYSA